MAIGLVSSQNVMINIFIAISIAVCWHFGMIDAVSGEVAGALGGAVRN